MSFPISVERRDSSNRTLSPSKLAGAITNSLKEPHTGGLHYQTINFRRKYRRVVHHSTDCRQIDQSQRRAALPTRREDVAYSFSTVGYWITCCYANRSPSGEARRSRTPGHS